MFGPNNYMKVWKITKPEKGNYYEVEGSTSRKNQDGMYETDFSSKFIRFVSKAREAIDNGELTDGDRCKIVNCGVSNSYNKETKKSYTNFVVFEIEALHDDRGGAKTEKPAKKASGKEKVGSEGYETPDDDLPF